MNYLLLSITFQPNESVHRVQENMFKDCKFDTKTDVKQLGQKHLVSF